MPGPFTVVTFIDAEEDEFPITLQGTYSTQRAAIDQATIVFGRLITEGKLRPLQPTRVKGEPYEWGNEWGTGA